MSRSIASTLAQQVAYYCARANEYDEWWFRKGRYDRGPELNAQWFADIDELEAALREFEPRGKVLELAGGTGIWTEKLHGYADQLTVVDASTEMLAINRTRIRSERVRYLQADLFDWAPSERFDVVFFSFWLSHVPDSKFESFLSLVRHALAPEGRVFFIDSRRDPTSTSADQRLPEAGHVTERRLNDGRTFNIYKIYYESADLEARLARLGWEAVIRSTSRYFIYGHCKAAGA
ncbi:MAG TPA: class I SAM-dependent methyltransferase [Gammaproteobacteria bacterium]